MTKEEERAKVAEFAEVLAKIIIKNNPTTRTYEILKAIANFYKQLKRINELQPLEHMTSEEIKATIVEAVKRYYDEVQHGRTTQD